MAGSSTVKERLPQHQVFINFRGVELRNGFVSHLVTAMESNDINVFIDDHEDRGEPIEKLLERIKESRIALPIFSGKYTESTWCLRELAMIKDCMDKGTLKVIPIFYKVLPSTVRDLKGKFGKAFRNTAHDDEREEEWRKAFREICKIIGNVLDEKSKESNEVKKTVEDVKIQLKKIPLEGSQIAAVETTENSDSPTSLSPEMDTTFGIKVVTKLTYEVEERPTQPTIGQEEMLETAWNRLMEDGVGFMGLHGIGGVGKTTLFKKVHNKFAEIAGRFDVVIWVVVSQGAKISKLQEDIAEKLNLFGVVWKNKRESDKAYDIYRVLKGKRFVLMLDDIWEKVDLEAIGVPFPRRENGCKVAFTTRSREVCGRMGDHEPMQVKCLGRDEAWKLFKSKVGEPTLRKDPVIVELARNVAEKCHGLPLALNVIGETMSTKTTVQEWEHAIDVLKRSAAEFSDMENKILPILKFSYDSLKDKHIQSCFLYCALFPEDYQIRKEDLIDYWICEGFIEEYQVIKKAMNKGYDILGTLICANLLMEGGTTAVVMMHDVVREMALWIASDLGKQKENFIVQANVGLREIPEVKDWGAVRRMSLMDNDIEEITCPSKCSELTTLFLQNNNKLKNLSGEFIQSVQKLVVLDLSRNRSFSELSEQISELASLQFLDLSFTSIEQLPVGFQELKKLTHLNLTSTKRLCSISGISKLSSLRILKLLRSKVDGDVSLLKELLLLEHLEVLTINISTELGFVRLLDDRRLANCTTSLGIVGLQPNSVFGIYMSLTESMKNPPCFTNLSKVDIYMCHRIQDLTWLLFAPNLVSLNIRYSSVEEIINKEEAINLTDITPFQKLESLELIRLPKLESIYWSPLPFPFLKRVIARECPKLKKLPLNATSGTRIGELSLFMYPEEQRFKLAWEDEDTKNRFLPSFK